MAFAFLTDTHLERYGRYTQDPTPEQLADDFQLDTDELAYIHDLRHDHTRLGYAVQRCTLRFLSTFLSDPTNVPSVVVRTLCDQLGIPNPGVLSRYCLGQNGTPWGLPASSGSPPVTNTNDISAKRRATCPLRERWSRICFPGFARAPNSKN